VTEQELKEIEARANAATKGPWVNEKDANGFEIWVAHPNDGLVADALTLPDTEFIAHARQDIPKLIAEVRRLREFEWMYKDLQR
jgi:hypothetical protein